MSRLTDAVIGRGVRLAYGLRRKADIDGTAYLKYRRAGGAPSQTTSILKAGSVHGPGALPLPVDMLFERDVAITLRDGVTIYTDILRPVGDAPVPAIVAWSPYGKNNPLSSVAKIKTPLSNLQKFEAPDPAYWVPRGYAVVNVDIRGSGHSEGNAAAWGTQEGRDGYDVVEWLAAQHWCSGKVGFAGNSYLAISQWFIGAERPPHLTALAPWEGLSDIYRHSVAPGGIPMPEFGRFAGLTMSGNGYGEDTSAMIAREPLIGAYWQDKVPQLERVEVPVYAVHSYTNKVHTRGTIHGFNRLGSRDKWLRIHNTHEWPDFYERQDDLARFFDRYLKGHDNGWEETPRVRMAVLDPGGTDTVDRPATSFPPPDVTLRRFHLDATTGTMGPRNPDVEASVRYDSSDSAGRANFTLRFDDDIEVAGFIKLRLWVSAAKARDIDIFLQAQKLDAHGKALPVLVFGAPYSGENGAPYEWGNGQLRVSHRKLDPERSRDDLPYLAHDEEQPLAPGEVVPVEIELPSMAMRFRAGEQLRVIIAGVPLQKPEFTFLLPPATINRGDTIVHAGGKYDSYLLLPIRRQEPA